MSSDNCADKRFFANITYQEGCLWLAFIIMIPGFSWLAFLSVEPFSLIDGTSIWPGEFIKMVALWLSIYLLLSGWDKMLKRRKTIEDTLGLPSGLDKKYKEKYTDKDVRYLWEEYKLEGSAVARAKRIWFVAVVWFVMCGLLYFVQKPNIPFRGEDAFWVDQFFTYTTFAGFVVLFAFVTDATMHCNRLIQQLIDKDTSWPFMFDVNGNRLANNQIQDMKREWYEIRLIGMRADDISKTVYYPIYIILLLLAAQSDYFDNFDMPASLMLIASLNIFLILAFSILLRRKAVEAKKVSLINLRKIEEDIHGETGKSKEITLAKLHFYKACIEEYREGAFLPISEQPWLRALTLMGGGGGSLLLLQMMAG